MLNKRKCTTLTMGTIVDLRVKGIDSPTIITVEYTAAGRTYEIKESIKLRREPIKLGRLPIGQRGVPVLGDTRVGSQVRVLFNPADPSKAYLLDNEGHVNVC